MKSAISISVLCLVFAVSAFGQAAAPNAPQPKPEINTGAHFQVNTSFVKLLSGGQATLVSAGVPLTPRFTLVYDQFIVPDAKSDFYLGAVRFSEILSHLLGSQAKKFLIPTDGVEVYVQGGIGTRRDDGAKNPSFAYEAQGGFNYPIGNMAGGKLSAGVSIGVVGSLREEKISAGRFAFGQSVGVSPQLKLKF